MNRIALTTLVLILSFINCFGGILTANDSMWTSSIEFNNDPTISNGPDYNYTWIPSNGQHYVNGVRYYGPGWVYAFYDFDWNETSSGFVPGYSVEIINGVQYVFGWVTAQPTFNGTTWIFADPLYSDTFDQFLLDWASLGGLYSVPLNSAPVLPGKRLAKGHNK